MRTEAKRVIGQWLGMFLMTLCMGLLAVQRASIVGRQQLAEAVNESVSRTGKRLDAMKEVLDKIAREVVPQNQNTRADWR